MSEARELLVAVIFLGVSVVTIGYYTVKVADDILKELRGLRRQLEVYEERRGR